MSKADNIQNKLDKAYSQVAKNLGRPFEIYRSPILDSPIQTSNYLDEQLIAFSKDDSYKTKSSSGLSIWSAWVDARLDNLFNLQNGDIFYNSQTNETYIVVGMEPHLTHQAVKANDRIFITRSGEDGYGDNDGTGFAPSNSTNNAVIAIEVPCQILQPSKYGQVGYVPTQSNAEDAIPNFEIYLWDENNEIKIRDKLVDQFGNQSEVETISKTDVGTKLICRGIPQ